MSRQTIPFATADISALAKSLRGQLAARPAAPSHVEMLNILARAGGFRNFQHLRAQAKPVEAAPAVDQSLVERAAGCFDASGRMARWPAKTSHQELCLWVLWAGLPSERTMTEAEVNDRLKAAHLFGDHAILRRSLCNSRLLWRTQDGREYRRVERAPTPEALALIRRVRLKG